MMAMVMERKDRRDTRQQRRTGTHGGVKKKSTGNNARHTRLVVCS